MFAKSAVFFLALVSLVNAAPVVAASAQVDVGPKGVWTPVLLGPGTVEFQSASAASSKRDTTLDLATGIDIGIEVSKRTSVDVDLGSDGVRVNLPHLRRGSVDLDTLTGQLVNTIGSYGIGGGVQGQGEVTNPYGSEYQSPGSGGGVVSGKRMVARDIQIDSQVLAQLQNLVKNTISLLQAAGNTDAVNTFLSQVNQLQTEVQNGTLDVSDLLTAAQNIILSIF